MVGFVRRLLAWLHRRGPAGDDPEMVITMRVTRASVRAATVASPSKPITPGAPAVARQVSSTISFSSERCAAPVDSSYQTDATLSSPVTERLTYLTGQLWTDLRNTLISSSRTLSGVSKSRENSFTSVGDLAAAPWASKGRGKIRFRVQRFIHSGGGSPSSRRTYSAPAPRLSWFGWQKAID